MRLPNGYGSVYKLSNSKQRRKKWIATKTTGWEFNQETQKWKRKRTIIGYYVSRSEALDALSQNSVPEKIEQKKLKFIDVWNMFCNTDRFQIMSDRTKTAYQSIYNQIQQLGGKVFAEITALQLQEAVNNSNYSNQSKRGIRSVLRLVYKFAMKHEIVDKDYAELIEIGKTQPVIQRKVFIENEIKILWDHADDKFVSGMLIMIYTGMRITEMLNMKKTNIDFQKRTMIGGEKTAAGKNRIIPISRKIIKLVAERFAKSKSDSLFDMGYNSFRTAFARRIKRYGMEKHTVHDCRHTFFSMMDNLEINPVVTKAIGGHKDYETTEKTYIHKNLDVLLKAVDQL